MAVESRVVESPVLYEIVLLGCGTMISKYCSDQAACPVEHVQVPPLHFAGECNKGCKMMNPFGVFLNSSSTDFCPKLLLEKTSS